MKDVPLLGEGVMENFDDAFVFADDPSDQEPDNNENQQQKNDAWTILIVDDEKGVHETTTRVLDDFVFEGKSLSFLSAYSGEEAKKILKENNEISVMLLDVVMETENAGLEVARYTREELGNSFIRINLRTGQPGKAPEKSVIIDYDINDYKSKTDLTAQKLFTMLMSSLRSYRDLRTIEKNRKGLEQIIESSAKLFELQSLKRFTNGIMTQLLSILHLDENSIYMKGNGSSGPGDNGQIEDGFTASLDNNNFIIQAATGKFKENVTKPVAAAVSQPIQDLLEQAIQEQRSLFIDDKYVGFFKTRSGVKHLVYFNKCKHLTELDKNLIRIFSNNVAIAFENMQLNKEVVDTQKEVIYTLGEVVENRSKETANHVHRVAEYSYLLAVMAGLDEEDAILLRYASPMHDVGKTGIPDAILLKPGKLTDEEFAQMKTHTNLGYEILKNSKREIMMAGAIVAKQHHEKWDGTGYPDGLKGETIHIFARITCLVDVFDALYHDRCYRKAWPLDRIIKLVTEETGKHFDPRLATIFLENVDEFVKIKERHPDGLAPPETCC